MAKKRATTNDLLRDRGFFRIKRVFRPNRIHTTFRLTGNRLSRRGVLAIGIRPVIVGGPLPDIAGHVIEACERRREGFDGGCAAEAVGGEVGKGEVALPGIGDGFARGIGLVNGGITPGEDLFFLRTRSRGGLPFGLSRESLARPLGISNSIIPRDLHHGIVEAAIDIGVRPFRVFPTRPGDPIPPGAEVSRSVCRGRAEDHGAWHQNFVGGFGGTWRELFFHFLPVGFFLGSGEVAGGVDEGLELAIGDFGGVDEKGFGVNLVSGLLILAGFAVGGESAHSKGVFRDEGHAFGGWTGSDWFCLCESGCAD